jgi:hypothetical protein
MRHLRRLGHSLAAGAFAGAALAPLQLLLWPEVSLSPAKACLALVAWTSWAAVWIGAVLFVLTEVVGLFATYLAANRGFSVGLWRWLMIAVSFVVAATAWWNREETRDLLLGDNRQALAASGSIATIYMVTLLVLAIQRRPPWPAPMVSVGLAALVVAALWVVWIATPVSKPSSGASVEPPPFAPAHRLLFVSWEGADLPWLLPAMERGDMPFLRKLWESGAWGQLRTVRPYARSATLATLTTGCAPAVHGVLGRRSYRVSWLTSGPVTLLLAGPWPTPHQIPWRAWERAPGLAPRRATLWQILLGAGRKVGLVGWPRYAQGTWTVPTPLAADVAPFSTLDGDLRAALEPALRAIPGFAEDARKSFALATALGATATRYATAEPVDALAIDYTLASHLRPQWTAEDPATQGEDLLHQAARLLDDQLRTLWMLEGGDALIVVVSPYGLGLPSSWQRLSQLVGTPRRWRVSPTNSPDGFVLFSGPGVRPGRLRTARLADVTATVLYLLELPVARDMAGRVLLEAVTESRASEMPLRMIPSYPSLPPSRPTTAPAR